MKESKRKAKAVVVDGGIAGISCAHALIPAGWDVVVLEKTPSPPTSCASGAGLGLDPLSQKLIHSWIKQPQLLQLDTLLLTIDQNQATDRGKKKSRVLARGENFNYRAAYWADLHSLLYKALRLDVVWWGHMFLSFSVSDDKTSVKVKSKVLQRGYFAWRGVLYFLDNEKSEIILGLKKTFPDLGRCLYFDTGSGTHFILYELMNERINWICYVNQPEPELEGKSVTMKVDSEIIDQMHESTEKIWQPELVKLIRETKQPFMNVIYDSEPLEQLSGLMWFWSEMQLTQLLLTV